MFAWIATRTGVQLPSPPALKAGPGANLPVVIFSHLYLPVRPPRPSRRSLAKADYCSVSHLVCNFLAPLENKASHRGIASVIKAITPINAAAPAFMNYRALGKISYHSAILLACVTLSCRPQQAVILSPNENDLVVLNGCVISACNYLAVVRTQHALDKNFWAKILLVRYNDHPAGHAYCVWETDGTIYGYDRNAGSFPIPVYTRDARAIAIVLAQELGKVMNEPLAVDRAEFVESQEAQLYKF